VAHVNEEDRRGQTAHFDDAAEIALHAGHLTLDSGFLFGGELGQLTAGLLLLVLLELGDRALDRLVVGQGAAEPAVDAVRHVDGRRSLADELLGLALGADKQDIAAIGDGVFQEGAGLLKSGMGLAQVDDGDALTVIEHEGLGTRVPALFLVAEVNACVEQVFGRDGDAHGSMYLRYTGRPVGRLAIVNCDMDYG